MARDFSSWRITKPYTTSGTNHYSSVFYPIPTRSLRWFYQSFQQLTIWHSSCIEHSHILVFLIVMPLSFARFATTAFAAGACLSLSACIIVDVHSHESVSRSADYSSVNKDLQVPKKQNTGDVSSVNGDIKIREQAFVDQISTVNGDIILFSGANAEKIESVNGRISLRDGARVRNSINSVNGQIEAQNSNIGSHIGVVNADVTLWGTVVNGNLTTVHGDVTLHEGSTIAGNLSVLPSRNPEKKPTITLAAGSEIQGTLILEQPIHLKQDPKAKVAAFEHRY